MDNSARGVLGILVVLVLGLIAWGVLTMPDHRSTGDRIGDAIEALPRGADKAADELKDRTPGQKIGDAIKETGEDIKDRSAR